MTLSDAFPHISHWIDAKLQRKLVLILSLLLLVTSLAFLSMVVALYKKQLVSEHARASMQVNQLLQTSLENAMLKRDIEGLHEIVGNLGVQQGIAGVAILDPNLRVRFSSDKNRLDEMLDSPVVRDALKTRSPQTSFIAGENESQLLRSVNPVHNKPECKQCHGEAESNPINGLLIVDYDATDIKNNALNTALMLGGIGAIVVLATGFGIWIALHWLVVSRLQRLHTASRLYAKGQFDVRTDLAGRDEIAELATSFDRMAHRLGQTLYDLNASGEFLQNVIDAIPDGVRVIDDDFTIIKANQAYCIQTGRAMNEVIGDKCYRSSHDRQEPCPHTLIVCPVYELRGASTATLKARHQHFNRDGEELFVEVSAARVTLTVDGVSSPCVIESIRDLAEQAKISHEQRLSEIGQLATGVAHEIHNPLSSILLALKALQQNFEDPENQVTDLDYLEIAEAEIAKCLEVTDRLLMLSVPPSEEVELIELDKIIRDVISLLSYQADLANVSISLELEKKLRVLGCDSDMRMIVINLAQNAIHAMPNGGALVVSAGHEDGWIELIFQDNGEGIEKRSLDKIFLPFWTKRADASEGRGLGLSICKAIVERAGGKISVESTIDIGTRFKILLPDADMVSKENE